MTFRRHESTCMEQFKALSQIFFPNSPSTVRFCQSPLYLNNSTWTTSASTELGVKHLVFSKTNADCFLQHWLQFCAPFSIRSYAWQKLPLFLHMYYIALIFLQLLLSACLPPGVPSGLHGKSWPHSDHKDGNNTVFDRIEDTRVSWLPVQEFFCIFSSLTY